MVEERDGEMREERAREERRGEWVRRGRKRESVKGKKEKNRCHFVRGHILY